MKFLRRTFVLLVVALAGQTLTYAQDLLASWNDGPAKQGIVDFVRTTTESGSAKFIVPEERIATFDQDGTLWVEHPIYSQMIYCLDRVPVLAKEKPEIKKIEPFKTVLAGDLEAISKLPQPDLEKIAVATLTGMTIEQFTKDPKLLLNDNNAGKPECIYLMIGRRPHAAFGNSTGDRQMLEYTKTGEGARISMLVLHDDCEREYAYGPAQGLPSTKVVTFTHALYDEAKKDGWLVISMKNDWKRIFAFED